MPAESKAAAADVTAPGGPEPRPTPWPEVFGLVVLLTAVLSVVTIAFAWPAVRASLHDIPLGVAGPPQAVARLEQGLEQNRPGAFETHRYPDETAARQAIERREVYGAVVLDATGRVSVLTASAASPAIAQALTQLAQAVGSAEPGAAAPSAVIRDVVPAPSQDPRGAGLGAGALPLVIGGIAAAAVFTVRVTGLARRITGALLFAVTGGLALTAILQFWLGSLDGDYWANSAVVALATGAIALTLLGLESLLGRAGLALGAAVMVLLGNPLSGLTSAPEMLPSGWGAFGQLLPPGAGGTLLRTVAFFPDGPAAGPLTVLLAWLAAGLALCAIGAARGRRGGTDDASVAASGALG